MLIVNLKNKILSNFRGLVEAMNSIKILHSQTKSKESKRQKVGIKKRNSSFAEYSI